MLDTATSGPCRDRLPDDRPLHFRLTCCLSLTGLHKQHWHRRWKKSVSREWNDSCMSLGLLGFLTLFASRFMEAQMPKHYCAKARKYY